MAEVWRQKVLEIMDGTHASFAEGVPPPQKIQIENCFTYRYVEQTLEQVIVQKLARIVTGLRSAQILISHGFLQEAATLQRSVDEAQEDITFLIYGRIADKCTKDHEIYLKSFWSDSAESKAALPRPRIRDFIAEAEATLINGSADAVVKPIKQIYAVYSGYAHASSVHVMELFDGNPPTWRLQGNVGSRLHMDHLSDIRNQYFRGLTAFAIAALLFDQPVLFKNLMEFAESFRASAATETTAQS
jgi:hypothetical protein